MQQIPKLHSSSHNMCYALFKLGFEPITFISNMSNMPHHIPPDVRIFCIQKFFNIQDHTLEKYGFREVQNKISKVLCTACVLSSITREMTQERGPGPPLIQTFRRPPLKSQLTCNKREKIALKRKKQ